MCKRNGDLSSFSRIICKKLSIDTEEVEEYNLKGFKTLLTFPKKKKDSKLTNSLLDMAKFQEIKIFFKIVISLLHRG